LEWSGRLDCPATRHYSARPPDTSIRCAFTQRLPSDSLHGSPPDAIRSNN